MTDGTETVAGAEDGQAGDPGIDIPAAPAEGGDPRIAELESEVAKLKDQLLRALADQENLRRRAERERDDAGKFAIVAFARDMVSVADNLRRALDSLPAEDDAEQEDETLKALREGVDATERELVGALERRGVKKVDPLGERFDPNFHEAMFEVAGSDQPTGTVVQVLQPGYMIHERLLRPARVAVVKSDTPPQKVDTTA